MPGWHFSEPSEGMDARLAAAPKFNLKLFSVSFEGTGSKKVIYATHGQIPPNCPFCEKTNGQQKIFPLGFLEFPPECGKKEYTHL